MARHGSRSRSYSPRRRSRTPPPRSRKRRDDSAGDRKDRRSPGSSGLLVRNLPLNARPEDLRGPFERFGPVKDVYLPKNYYTGEPRGFGFVKYRYADDAAEAKQQLDHSIIGGREIRILFAEENRKTPREMRIVSRSSGRHGGSFRRRTPPRSPRRRYHSYSRSPSPIRHHHRHRDEYLSSVHSRSVSRSPPHDDRDHRRSSSQSPRRGRDRRHRDDYHSTVYSHSVSRSPPHDDRDYRKSHSQSPRRGDRDGSRSPSPTEKSRTPANKRGHARSTSRSPQLKAHSPSGSRSQSYSRR